MFHFLAEQLWLVSGDDKTLYMEMSANICGKVMINLPQPMT